ncbi:MAG TPA: Uma2 family endonuclease, partial [Cytophagales bacterium]
MEGLDQPKRVTVEEYLVNEARAEYKSEYHNGILIPVHRTVNERGEIVTLDGAQPAHNLLVAKIMALMGLCPDDTDSPVYASGQLVYLRACERLLYPDTSVVYQKPEYLISKYGLDALLNPSVIIEVLSEGTEAYDRGEKF